MCISFFFTSVKCVLTGIFVRKTMLKNIQNTIVYVHGKHFFFSIMNAKMWKSKLKFHGK